MIAASERNNALFDGIGFEVGTISGQLLAIGQLSPSFSPWERL